MSIKNKFFATTATAAMVASAIVPVASAAEFTDADQIPTWAQEAVEALVNDNVLQGSDGKFNPAGIVTRAQAAEIIYKALDLKAEGTEDFSDVKPGDWFYNAVLATSPEIFEGDDQGQFNPKGELTREQAATVIVRAFGLTGEADLSAYPDASNVSGWAKEAMAIAVENGVIKGKGENLAPKASISRAEIAVMVNRAMQDTVEEVTVESAVATDANTVEVTLSNGTEETITLKEALEANVETEITFTIDGVEYTASVTFEVEDFVVESVSAITTTTVDVTITAPEEDVLGATVEVKDGAGNVVEVNPVDISAGDKVASFTFKTAVKVEDLVGVWTVDGKEYSFDAIKQLKDITDAASATPLNEVKLLAALNAASIKDVNDDKLKDYADAIVDASPEALADVQKAINNANKTADEKAADAAAVKAVEEATNQIQLLAALEANFDRVNEDWIGAYTAGKKSTNPGTATDAVIGFIIKTTKTDANKIVTVNDGDETSLDVDNIQEVIDAINSTQVAASYDKAFKSLKTADVNAARTEANAYLTVAEEEGDFDAKAYANDSLDILDALIRVNTATTNNSLKTALVSLDNLETELVEKYKNNAHGISITDDFDIKKVNENLLANYRKAISDQTDVTKKNQRGDINAIIVQANQDASAALVKAVQDEANAETVDADKLVKALQNLGLKQVATSNKATYAENINFKTVANADAAQAQVDADNIKAIKALKNAGDGDKLITALNVVELKNVKPENKDAYVLSVAANGANDIGSKSSLTDIQTVINSINKQATIDAAVKTINDATTATEVMSALDSLSDEGEISAYLNVTSSDRIFIAEQVLETRDELKAFAADPTRNEAAVAKEFYNNTEVGDAVTTATGKRTSAINGVNALVSAMGATPSDLTTIANALLAVGHDSLSGEDTATSADTVVAEKFIKAITVDENGKPSPKFTSISAIRSVLDGLK